jgi:hypothetical protein
LYGCTSRRTEYLFKSQVNYTGLSLEESYGNGWIKSFHPDDQKSALDAWQNAIANNTAYFLNAECVKKWCLFLVFEQCLFKKKEMLLNGLEHAPIYKTSKKQESNY